MPTTGGQVSGAVMIGRSLRRCLLCDRRPTLQLRRVGRQGAAADGGGHSARPGSGRRPRVSATRSRGTSALGIDALLYRLCGRAAARTHGPAPAFGVEHDRAPAGCARNSRRGRRRHEAPTTFLVESDAAPGVVALGGLPGGRHVVLVEAWLTLKRFGGASRSTATGWWACWRPPSVAWTSRAGSVVDGPGSPAALLPVPGRTENR